MRELGLTPGCHLVCSAFVHEADGAEGRLASLAFHPASPQLDQPVTRLLLQDNVGTFVRTACVAVVSQLPQSCTYIIILIYFTYNPTTTKIVKVTPKLNILSKVM